MSKYGWNEDAYYKLKNFLGYKSWETGSKRKINQLRKHLESKFEEGMDWYNYGDWQGDWQIDHIIPKKYKDPATGIPYWYGTTKSYNDLNNLQPMWKWENISKSNRYIGQYKPIVKSKKTNEQKSQLPPFLYDDTAESKEIINNLKNVLTGYEYTFFTYLLKGHSQSEISKKVNKKKSQAGRDSLIIRVKIMDYLEKRGFSVGQYKPYVKFVEPNPDKPEPKR